MRHALLVLAACGGSPKPATTESPVLTDTVAKAGKQQLELYLLGSHTGTEYYEVAKTTTGFHVDVDATWGGKGATTGKWTIRLDVNPDWTVREAVVSKLVEYSTETECTIRMHEEAGFMEQLVELPGREPYVATREPMGPISYVVIRPAVTQLAICHRATAQPVTLMNFPAFRVEVSPRETVTLPDGRTLDKVRVDDLIDVYCADTDVAIVHYGKHGFLAVQPAYATYGKNLAVTDPRTEPWDSRFECPQPRN